MSRVFRGEFTTAIRMLQRNKSRSILTMVGIIIGVASVVTTVAIGQGVQLQIAARTQHLGKDLITVRPGQLSIVSSNNILASLAQLSSAQASGGLNGGDVLTVQHTPGVSTTVALSLVAGGVTSGETNKQYNIPVVGTDPGLPAMLNQTLAFGDFLDPHEGPVNEVVLGSQAAQTLFDQNVPLGQTVSILGNQFIVTGIFNTFQTAPLSTDLDFNNAVFISSSQAQAITNNHALVYEVLVRPTQLSQTDALVSRLNGALLAARGGQHDFTVMKQGQTILVANAILHFITMLVAGVAAISLLVGGVGIMNVMLVSVTERMHEIGIRKAVGATNRQILVQFIIEAAVLSIVGATAGVVLSFAIAITLGLLTDLSPVVTWQAVVFSSLAAVGVGVFFGSAPALKAARKEPISALRNE